MKYLLQLGRLPELSLYESQQLFSQLGTLYQVDTSYLVLKTKSDRATVLELLQKSAGIIKGLEIVSTLEISELSSKIVEDLASNNQDTFAVYFHNTQKQQYIFKEVKNGLKAKGISGRYVESSGEGLSAAVLSHHKVAEYGLFSLDDEISLAKTIWIQNIDHWTVKDIDKPHRNPDKGMLPPKLARMMVNFVSQDIQKNPQKRLLDPFCGSATLLMEGLELGWAVIGSDISQEAVTQAAENLRWFTLQLGLPEKYSLACLDATQIDKNSFSGTVDAIVTEPFLGRQQPRPDHLPGMFKGLEKQYLGILKRWTQVLADGGEVVIVTPVVETPQKKYDLSKIIDKSREFGYSILSGPHMYSRGHTIVKRAIYHLKLTK